MLMLGWINEGIQGAFLWLITPVYKLAAFAFKIFLILATGKLVSADSYKKIIENFYVVIGVILLFVLAFSFLRAMVNPEDSKQGTSMVKKIILNLITSSVLMALLPSIFAFAFDFQDSIVLTNTIGKFFGYGNQNDSSNPQGNIEAIEQGANQIVNGIYTAFFNVSEEECSSIINSSDSSASSEMEKFTYCQEQIESDGEATIGGVSASYSLAEVIEEVDRNATFSNYAAFAGNIDDNEIDFNGFISLIGGLALLYVAVSYCFDMALRLVKLVFYQIIAPLPIFMRVIPEGKLSGMFNSWMKVTLTCYLEVYIRIVTFYFVVYLCKAMMSSSFLTREVFQYGFFTGLFTNAFVLMGVITFMRQAPKLFAEVTGIDSGKMKLGIRDKLAAGGAFTAGSIAGAGITALANNGVRAFRNVRDIRKNGGSAKEIAKATGTGILSTFAGGASGAFRGGRAGINAKSVADMKKGASTGAKGAIDARNARAKYKAKHGGTVSGVIEGHIQDKVYDLKSWAGINNVDSLIAEDKLIDQISNQRKAIDDEAKATLLGDVNKAGKNIEYGLAQNYETITWTDSEKNVHSGTYKFNTQTLRDLQQELTAAQNSGDQKRIKEAQGMYDTYLDAFKNKLVDQSLKGITNWDKLKSSDKADLAKIRQLSDTYRETLARNMHLPYVASLDGISDVLDKDLDLNIEHSSMKKIKDVLKIQKTQNERLINEFRQKEAERKESK